MKLLVVLFFAVLCLSNAVPLSQENEVGVFQEYRQLLDDVAFADDPKTELGRILKKHLVDILENIRDIIDNGRAYKEDLIEKAKEIKQKLKDIHVDIGDHARKVIQELKEKAKGYWKRVLERLGLNSETYNLAPFVIDVEARSDLSWKLKEELEEILEKLQEIYENGKAYNEDLLEKFKEVSLKLKEMGVDIGDHARQVLSGLKDKARDYWNRILGIFRSEEDIFFTDVDEEYAARLRERLNEILDKIKDAFETRTTLGGRYLAALREIWNEMREKSISIGDLAKDRIQELKGKTNGVWKKILETILPNDS